MSATSHALSGDAPTTAAVFDLATSPTALLDGARRAAAEGRFEEALDGLHHLAEAHPSFRTPLSALVEAQVRFGLAQYDAGLRAALDAIDLDPENDGALRLFGVLLDYAEELEQSERCRRAVLRLLQHPEQLSRTEHRAACQLIASAIQAHTEEAVPFDALPADLRALLRDLLFHRYAPGLNVERMLIGIRRQILELVVASETGDGVSAEVVELAEGLARHAFTTEYLWDETPEEAALLATLQARLEARLRAGAPAPAREVFALGAYRDLSKVSAVRDWIAALVQAAPETVDPTLALLVFNPLAEAVIAEGVQALTPIDDAVSRAVQAQYEANPYPRWRTARPVSRRPYVEAIQTSILPTRTSLTPTSERPRVLVAGCGTGQHPIDVARTYADAEVLAIDLSRASLAYATRQALALGVKNVSFAQADLLLLPELAASFDVIDAGGVLHHLRDPEEGLRALLSALKPGGYLRLGLYSRIARRDVARARSYVAEQGLAPDLAGLRTFRRAYLAGEVGGAGDLTAVRDFYHASDLRDLVFHVQEHQMSLPEIGEMLARNGLEFLGFAGLPTSVRGLYAAETPEDPAQTDLAAWARFEERHPHTFIGMYQFWTQKPADGAQ